MQKIRKRILFSGRVQGVGFRYIANRIAQSLRLTGWVRNTHDNRVEMEIQGDRVAIDQMLVQLYQERYIQIDKMDIKAIPVVEENCFRVKST